MKDQFAVSDLRRLGVSTSVDVQPAEQEGNRFDDWTVEPIATLLRWPFFVFDFLRLGVSVVLRISGAIAGAAKKQKFA